MASVVIAGDTSGTVTLQAPAVAGSTTLNLPATNGTVALSSQLTGGMIYIGSANGVGNTGFTFTNIPAYSALFLMITGNNATANTYDIELELSSNNGSSYGAVRRLFNSIDTNMFSGQVHISNTSNAGASKVVTPLCAGADTMNVTQATESVVTGVINALRVTSTGAAGSSSMKFGAFLFGIV